MIQRIATLFVSFMGLEIREEFAALVSLFAIRAAVVVAIENILARVEPVSDDSPWRILSTIIGYPTTADIVWRSGRRALARLIELGGVALFGIAIVRTRFAAPTGSSDPIQ
ncbi:hypothetical protein EL22_19650 [Halostagnicola sp. A56]|nr:hypothetical protein EL22_19650 [Halostagnicola sp. A56]